MIIMMIETIKKTIIIIMKIMNDKNATDTITMKLMNNKNATETITMIIMIMRQSKKQS
jgi:ribosomal silencing factor RsfS